MKGNNNRGCGLSVSEYNVRESVLLELDMVGVVAPNLCDSHTLPGK